MPNPTLPDEVRRKAWIAAIGREDLYDVIDAVTPILAGHFAVQRPPVGPDVEGEIVDVLCEAGEEYDRLPGEPETGGYVREVHLARALLARFSFPSQPVYDEEMVERAAKAMWELRMLPTDPAWADVDRYVRVEYEKDARAALVAALRGGELTREETP